MTQMVADGYSGVFFESELISEISGLNFRRGSARLLFYSGEFAGIKLGACGVCSSGRRILSDLRS